MIYLYSVLVIYFYNFWQATSSLPLVIERYFPALSWLPAATSDLVLLLVLVKWKGWETKSHSHLGAGLQKAAREVGVHTNNLSHPKSLLCSLTLLPRADQKAMGDFNKGKFIIPPRLKSKKSNEFLLFLHLHLSVLLQVSCSYFSIVSHCTIYHFPQVCALTNIHHALSMSPPRKSP